MKRLIAGLITITLAVIAVFGLTACGGGKETTSMKDWGEIKNIGGAIAETENYLYYINGVGSSTDGNAWGKPVKGALMVADKSTIGTDEVKTEIVVPKLLVASDYGAGVYLFGKGDDAYVYYATPSTSKDASGSIASNSLTFARTKLDGTNTEEFFTVKGLSTDYRIAEKDGDVYVVYYDDDADMLKSYNTSDKTEVVIAKIDDKTTEEVTLPGGSKVYLSLLNYTFIPNGFDLQVVFTMTVYAENYFAEKAEDEGEEYVRAQESFNLLYTYSVGDEKDASGVYGKVLCNGEEKDLTFDITLAEDGYLFYSQKDLVGKTETYALPLNDLSAGATIIKNADYVSTFIVVNSLEEVYFIDSEKLVVYKSTLIEEDTKVKETVIPGDKVSTLLYVHGDYMYYYAKSGKIARILLDGNSNEEIVSNDIVSSVWYDPEIINVNGVNYLFYIDSSTEGSSYFKYVNIDKDAVLDEGEDENTESDDFYTLEGFYFLGKMTDKDAANMAISALEGISSTALEYEIDDDGKLNFTAVAKARAEYDKLSAESKKHVSENLVNKLANAEKAQTLARYYYDIRNYKNYAKMSEAEKQDLESAYNEAKAYRQSLINEKNSVYTTIRDFLPDDLKVNYQECAELFDADK